MFIVTINGVSHLEREQAYGSVRYDIGDSLRDAYRFESCKDALIGLARAANQGLFENDYLPDALSIRIEKEK